MLDININLEGKNLQEEFAYRQIGSITAQIEPVDASTSLDFVLEFFRNNPAAGAIPVERNGALMGILERQQVEKMTESAWTRFWQKDLDAYIKNPLLSLRADDYIEKNIERVMELNDRSGVRLFAVYYRRSFFGIVGIHEMLTRISEIRGRDMEKARMVQQHMLKSEPCATERGYALYTWNRMANEVGGDFFKDFSYSDGKRHIIGCFDVSGKNVAASLSTMAVGSFFTALKSFDPGTKFGLEITRMIDKYIQDLTPTETFITAGLCYVDEEEGTVFIQNCGHTPIYLFIPGEDKKIVGKTMNPNLPPLGMGILESESSGGYRLPITKGLRIVMYTDGLTDMQTPDGIRFDDDRTRKLFVSTHGKPEAETMSVYEQEVHNWVTEAMLPDDITIMDLRFR
jgi:serine phosphatase RsbU (regulator of sigma subunit)